MAINQNINTSGRNINLLFDTDYPNFDLIINGIRYEKDPQNNKTVYNGISSSRSRGINQKISNTNALQRAIIDRMYQTAERLQNY